MKHFWCFLCSPTVFFLWEQNCCLFSAASSSSSSSSWSSLSWSRYLLQRLPSVLPSYNTGELLKTAKHEGSHFWYCYTCAECLKSWISLGHAHLSCSQVQFPVEQFLCTTPSVSAGASLIWPFQLSEPYKGITGFTGIHPGQKGFVFTSAFRDPTFWTELSSCCAAPFLLSFTESSTHLK